MPIDVAGAFKVLIEANPSQANTAFQSILDSASKTANGLKAIDTGIFGTDLTEKAKQFKNKISLIDLATAGLSKTFSLIPSVIGGAINGLESLAKMSVDAGQAFAGFVARGGDFNEQFKQFNIFADSFGQSGTKIISTFKEVSNGTITAVDSMRIATKFLAAGIVGGDLETILTYAKKWSEATKEPFESVAESIASSFQKGTTRALKDVGLIVKTGATYASVIDLIKDKNQQFGETGVNLGDIFKSVSVRFDEFKTQIAGAIADSPALIKLTTDLADSFLWFINIFGGNKTVVTNFFEVIFQSLDMLWSDGDATLNHFIGNIDDSFQNGEKLAKTALTNVLSFYADTFQEIAVIVVGTVNTIMDALSVVGAIITKPLALIGKAAAVVFNSVSDAIASLWADALNFTRTFVSKMFGIFASFPNISDALGLTTLGRNIETSLREMEIQIKGSADASRAFTQSMASGFMGADFEREKFFEGMKIDVPDFTGQAAKATAAINKIKPGATTDWDNLSSKVKRTGKHIEVFGKDTMPKTMKQASVSVKKEASDIGKSFTDIGKSIGDTVKSFGDIFGSATAGVTSLTKELSDAFTALADLEIGGIGKGSQFDRWKAQGVRREQIQSLFGVLRAQLAFQNRAITAAEAQARAQAMLAEALTQAQKSGILHKITVQDFSKFMNDFLADVFKRAGILARAENVRIAGA